MLATLGNRFTYHFPFQQKVVMKKGDSWIWPILFLWKYSFSPRKTHIFCILGLFILMLVQRVLPTPKCICITPLLPQGPTKGKLVHELLYFFNIVNTTQRTLHTCTTQSALYPVQCEASSSSLHVTTWHLQRHHASRGFINKPALPPPPALLSPTLSPPRHPTFLKGQLL